MGTPAFPDLGKHCSVEECKQIDFLPFTCDRCHLVLCLEHRSYKQHNCAHADHQGVTVVVCPLCAKGVRLIPDQDANITWETHVNTACDPTNYDNVTKKRKCPASGCREILVFSNTVKCKDCTIDHCLKHRFGPDHNCAGPPKPTLVFPYMNFLSSTSSRKEAPRPSRVPTQPSSAWSRFVNAASAARASAEASVAKLSSEFNQALQVGQGGKGSSAGASAASGGQEVCPQCGSRFSSVTALVEHVQRVHEKSSNRTGVMKLSVDVCPKCSRGFRDPVALVEHVEKDHGGTSKA